MRMRDAAGMALALSVFGGAAIAQTREGKDAFGSWPADKPGTVRLIRPQDLPAPGPSSANASYVVPRPAGVMPQVPAGFNIELFAEGSERPAHHPHRAERRYLRRGDTRRPHSRSPCQGWRYQAGDKRDIRDRPSRPVRHRVLSQWR